MDRVSQATKTVGVAGAAAGRARLLARKRAERIVLCAQGPDAPLAVQAREALEEAEFHVELAEARFTDIEGVVLVADDDGLERALRRLTNLMPGQAVYANVLLCTEEPERAGGLLAEGFRDIVTPAQLVRAVEAVLRGQPPLLVEHIRAEIEGPFFEEFVGSMKQRAMRRLRLLHECVDLIRECEFVAQQVRKLEDRTYRDAVDQLLVSGAHTESYILQIYEQHRFRIDHMPSFPKEDQPLALPREREPRWKKRRQFLDDMVERMRAMGWTARTEREGPEALSAVGPVDREKPLFGLREYLRSLEEQLVRRKKEIEEINVAVDPIQALQEKCLDRYHFGILSPGIAVPQYIASVIRSLAQPPAEIYLSWVIDLRDMRVKLCSAVLEEIRKGLSETRVSTCSST